MSEPVKPVNPAELEQAFTLFNEVSAQLTDAYQELQQQVAQLTHELAEVNAELRQQLQEKQALSQRLASLLQALPAGVVVLDDAGYVMEANPAANRMLGGLPAGAEWRMVMQSRFTPTGSPHEWGLDNSISSGSAVPRISMTDSPQDDGRHIVLLHDISEAHAMQQELQRHQRLSAMGEMSAGLAHQLRTPLATALLYTANLTKPNLPEQERIRFAEKSLVRLRHLEHLIQDMLLFVKGEQGAHDIISLAGLLSELQQVIEPQMQQHGLHLRISDNSHGAAISGNHKALTGALLNLLENAMQASPSGSVVSLEMEADEKIVSLSVTDQGHGIDAAMQERLFQPFFTTRAEGTGLGLAIVRGVVQACGGDVRVQSAPGAGSRFILTLPRLLANQDG